MSPYLFHALLLVGCIVAIAGTVIVLRNRRESQRALEPVYVPLYAQDDTTGEFVVVGQAIQGQSTQAAPEVATKPTKWQKRAKTLVFSLCMMALFFSPLVFVEPAQAGLSQAMKGIFNNELKEFVSSIMLDTGGAVYGFAWMMFLAGSVLMFVIEIAKFIQGGTKAAESNVQAVMWWFATFAIMTGYDAATSAIWGVAVGISNGFQEHLVGNTDNFFLAQWIHKATAAVVVEDISLFDTVKMAIYYVGWMIVGWLLDLVAALVAMWADFGYALAKVVGLIFIPFLLLPATRNLFDAWFKFFTGFGFLLIVLKATMVVAAISVKAIMTSLGVSFSGGGYGEPSEVVQIGLNNLYLLSDASAMLAIAILFVLSSFAFASSLAGGLGNLSGGLGTAAGLATRKLLK